VDGKTVAEAREWMEFWEQNIDSVGKGVDRKCQMAEQMEAG
jgi:hypothetical protein